MESLWTTEIEDGAKQVITRTQASQSVSKKPSEKDINREMVSHETLRAECRHIVWKNREIYDRVMGGSSPTVGPGRTGYFFL